MAELEPSLNVPIELRAQQATNALGGFVYQIHATALAWLALGPNDVLLVEVAEDYATLVRGEVQAVQVRNTGAAISLRTPGVQQVISNNWALGKANCGRAVRSVYLTTSQAAREQHSNLPKGVKGLEAWNDAKQDGEVEALAALLGTMRLPLELKTWLAKAPTSEIRARLVSRITWRLGAPDAAALKAQVEDEIIARARGLRFMPAEARRAATGIFLGLLDIAASAGPRELRAADLDQMIQDSNFVLVDSATLRAGRAASEGYVPPLSDRTRDDSAGRLFFFGAADRTAFIGRALERTRLLDWARRSTDFSWTLITGAGGMGKSRLALELCQALGLEGWHAGFLSPGSALASADKFATFRPTRPTLIVIDYVSLSAEWAGDIVRTLIDASTIEPFAVPVRVLLLERTGPASPWWETFNGQHLQRLMGRSARLDGATFLNLQGLQEDDLWRLFEGVAGSNQERHRALILPSLQKIDPKQTPLFTSLAAEATRAGREIWQFDRDALLHDIFLRERTRWRALARDETDLQRHELGAALATMVGGLTLEDARRHAPSAAFPFAADRFNAPLAQAITGPPPSIHQMVALEPDILGEWFTLRQLRPVHGFDERPKDLRAAAEGLIGSSRQLRYGYAGFRARLAQDFASDAMASGLYDPPSAEAPPDVVASWMSVLANTLEDLEPVMEPETLSGLFDAVIAARDRLKASKEVQVSATAFIGVYAAIKVDRGDMERATELLHRLDGLPGSPEHAEAAHELSRAGYWVGRALADQGEVQRAFAFLERLRTQAEEFRQVPDSDWPEMLRYAATLGLAMRRGFLEGEEPEAVAAVDRILWDPPPNDREDLAATAAEVLATSAVDEGIIELDDALTELERRSRERREVRMVAVWTARALLAAATNEHEDDDLVGRVRRLGRWLKPRRSWPEMQAVYSEALHDGLLDEALELGEVPVRALLDMWLANREAAVDAGFDADDGAYVRRRRDELAAALAVAADSEWVSDILKRYRGAGFRRKSGGEPPRGLGE